MEGLTDLLRDHETAAGRGVSTLAVVVGAILLAWLAAWVVGSRVDDPYTRYHVRKAVRYAIFVIALIALAVIWRPFAGRIGVVLGLAAAGVAFAMQEVIGAIAGWFNIISGRIYSVGDRVEVGGVRGDVVDITPLRTKILEIGSPAEGESWVRGRQLTGRVVAVSNKLTFTQPVFNYSAAFEHIWEELTLPVDFRSDWREAERIMREEAERASTSDEARAALREFTHRHPVPRADVEPRVFVRTTDDWIELSARFIVPVRTARAVKDEITRRVHDRFVDAGIDIASETIDATIRVRDDRDGSAGGPGGTPHQEAGTRRADETAPDG
jgi:small-conductance mechanosensitive channel